MSISDEDKSFVKDNLSKVEATNTQRTFDGFFVHSDRAILALKIGPGNLKSKAKRQLSQFSYNQGSA